MLIVLLALATGFLAYANGANDNFKGVASLFGSGTVSYRNAILWATLTTFAGSIGSLLLAQSLITRFSANGIVADQVAGSVPLLLAVAIGTGLTVIIATLAGFPVSTTHALTGAIVGSSVVAARGAVNVEPVVSGFLLPLLLSPILAVLVASALLMSLRWLGRRSGVSKEWCICVGERPVAAVPQPVSMAAWRSPFPPVLEIAAAARQHCEALYPGHFLGLPLQRLVDAAHFLSAGLVGFARGLNDTPKIVAIVIAAQAFDVRGSTAAIAIAMAIGGLLSARRVAETMSRRITPIARTEGFAANLSTGVLVVAASTMGLPVSTTHVSVGSLFGIGLTARTANMRVIRVIAFAWLLTLPCGALFGALVYSMTGFVSNP